MVTITVQVSGEIYGISTVEDLTKVQNMLTQKFFEQYNNEDDVIERYFRDTPHLEIYDRVCDNPDLMSEIVDRAVECETNYSTLEEVSDALSGMEDALESIYNYAREWI